MALINCSECDKEISDKAMSCPNCGAPNNEYDDDEYDDDLKETSSDKLYCPKCGSDNLTSNNKGFGIGKAAIGGVLLGPVGLLAGTIGSSKIKVTCLKCGKVCKAGELIDDPALCENEIIARSLKNGDDSFIAGCALFVVIVVIVVILLILV